MIARVVRRARQSRGMHLAVINLRYLIGFAFLPSALKKLLDQPFTDPTNHGRFHDFLHAFHATGWFYPFVGALQIAASALLFTQRFATLGALVALPILTAITAFCWSTQVYPTAVIATLMWLGTAGLVLWDLEKWRGIFARDDQRREIEIAPSETRVDLRLWGLCGLAMLAVYLGSALVYGGVYRPRGLELDNPAFYVMPTVLLLPVVTFFLDRRGKTRTNTIS